MESWDEMGRMALVPATLLVAVVAMCRAFYIPGMLPSEFSHGANLEIKVRPSLLTGKKQRSRVLLFSQAVSMTSTKTQLPYEYYSLSFCGLEKPEDIHYKSLNLGKREVTRVIPPLQSPSGLFSPAGEVLRGDRIVNTLYKVSWSLRESVCERERGVCMVHT